MVDFFNILDKYNKTIGGCCFVITCGALGHFHVKYLWHFTLLYFTMLHGFTRVHSGFLG